MHAGACVLPAAATVSCGDRPSGISPTNVCDNGVLRRKLGTAGLATTSRQSRSSIAARLSHTMDGVIHSSIHPSLCLADCTMARDGVDRNGLGQSYGRAANSAAMALTICQPQQHRCKSFVVIQYYLKLACNCLCIRWYFMLIRRGILLPSYPGG